MPWSRRVSLQWWLTTHRPALLAGGLALAAAAVVAAVASARGRRPDAS